MTIGSRIAKCRKKKNLSQTYVAEALDLTRQAVSKWETDVNVPDTENLIKLAKLFGTTVEYLACGEDGAALKITENISVLNDDESIFDDAKADTSELGEDAPKNAPSVLSKIFGYLITFIGFTVSFVSCVDTIFIFPLLIGLGIMVFGIYLTLRTKRFWD